MVATASRIGFVLEPVRRAVSETADTAAHHGNLARETADPLDTWFSTVADAQIRADERQSLLSSDRRLFDVELSGEDIEELFDLMDAGEVPGGTFIDTERGLDIPVIATEFVIDIDAQGASIKVWG
tara:strand:- start:446 stop:823 length:378 start_codon:yes stop_codon:yes gene_type:complete